MKDAESPALAQEFADGVVRDFAEAKRRFDELQEWLEGLEEGLRFYPSAKGTVRGWRTQLQEYARQSTEEAAEVAKKLTNGDSVDVHVDQEHQAKVVHLRREANNG